MHIARLEHQRKKKAGSPEESPLRLISWVAYLAGITGTGAGSGDEPQEVVNASPAAAAASAITLTNFIMLFSIY